MARRGLGMLVSFVVALAGMPLLSSGAGATPADGDVVPGAWIVTLAPGVSPDDVAADHGRRLGASVDHVYQHAARGYAARMSAGAAAKAAADPRVQSVVPDRYVSIAGKANTTSTTSMQPVPFGIQRVYGYGANKAIGAAVAVIDTGIDKSHPDLNVRGGYNCSNGSPAAWGDGNGHGTHVAGTIGAKDDTVGVVGVAPGTPLYAVRVLNNAGSGSWSSIICGINWVKANAGRYSIKVANMSLGGSGGDAGCNADGLHKAICDADDAVTFVVAAGNSATDAKNFVPAAYDEVITVSALADFNGLPGGGGAATCRSDVDDTFANFSNHGADVDIIAPGVCITSTWRGGSYNTISGTSMASPHVAGAAALYAAHNPTAGPVAVRAAVLGTGTSDWDDIDDPDIVKEPLLRVDTL